MHAWPRPRARLGLLLLLALPLAGCGGGRGAGRVRREPSAAPEPVPVPAGSPARTDATPVGVHPGARDTLVHYAAYRLANGDSLRALARRLGPRDFDRVLRLNRIDLDHAREGDTLVVPSTFDWARLAPLPDSLPAASALRRLLVVSARVQAFGAYEAGRLVRWGPTSTGREEKRTPPGLYHANWRQSTRVSTFNDEWVLHWYVNLSNFDGISLHQYELPGRPASHACVRLLADDAEWLYHWVDTWKLVPGDRRRVLEQGTPVVVMDEYAFGQRRPWKLLPDDPHATTLRLDEVESALRSFGALAPDSVR